jgi:hypothetical protein
MRRTIVVIDVNRDHALCGRAMEIKLMLILFFFYSSSENKKIIVIFISNVYFVLKGHF